MWAYPAGWDKVAGTRKYGPNPGLAAANHSEGVAVIFGSANFFSDYVEGYAHLSATLTKKLKVGRGDGKNGSKKPLVWDEKGKAAFLAMKEKLVEGLMLFQPYLDQHHILHVDASDYAIGAVLRQQREGKRVLVAFLSKILTKNQLIWPVWDKEMYGVVAALQKWAGLIEFQPVKI